MKFYLISLCIGITCSIRVPTVWNNDRDETEVRYPIIQGSNVRFEPDYSHVGYDKLTSQLNSPLDLNYSPGRVYQNWINPPRVNKDVTTNKPRKSNEKLKNTSLARKQQSNLSYRTTYGKRQPINSTNFNVNKSLRKYGNVYTPKERNVQQSMRKHHVIAPNYKIQVRNHKEISHDNWVPILDPTISKQKNFGKKQRVGKIQRKTDTFSELNKGGDGSKHANEHDYNEPLKRNSQLRTRKLNNKGDKMKSERNNNDEDGHDADVSPPTNFDERVSEEKSIVDSDFVPYRSYAQTRRSESAKHFPRKEAENMRLREIVKDSKIHTVYTEEGYEDSAYNHGNRKKGVDTAEQYVGVSKEKVIENGTINNDFEKSEEKSDDFKDDLWNLSHIERKDDAQYINANGERIPKQKTLKNMKETNLDNIESVQVDSQNAELSNKNRSTKMSLNETIDEVNEKKKNAEKIYSTDKKDATISSDDVEDDEDTKDIKRYINWDSEVLPSRKINVKNSHKRNTRKKGVHNISARDVSKIVRRLSNFEIYSDKKFDEEKIPVTVRKSSHKVGGGMEIPMAEQNDVKRSTEMNYDVQKESALKKNIIQVLIQPKSRLRRDIDQTKFPYYNSENFEKNSALRYAENIENKPDKRRDDLAFYNKAEHNFICHEDPANFIQPPILRNDEKSNNGQNSLSGKFGDKIDCLKSKYFEDDPFDNPLFSEKGVKPLLDVKQNSQSLNWLQKNISRKTTVERNEATATDDSKDDFKQIRNDGGSDFQIPNQARNLKIEGESEVGSIVAENVASEAQALIKRRLRQRRRKRPINRFPPRFTSSHASYISPDSSFDSYMPTQKISEVHYKNEIKPNEQMNVFADVINNIKNASNDLDVDESDQLPVVAVQKPPPYRKKRPMYREKLHSKYERRPPPIWEGEVVSNDSFYPIVTSHKRPLSDVIFEHHSVHSNKILPQTNVHKSQTSYDNDKFDPQSTYLDLYKASQTNQKFYDEENENYFSYPISHSEQTKKVGRRPHNTENRVQAHAENSDYSSSANHRHTYKDLDVKPSADIFYVVGMRPPPENIVHPHQLSYGHLKRRRFSNPRHRRIVKRSINYSEIKRTKQKTDDAEEDDDYVPHRSRSFHYDPSTGKIVYDKKEEVEETYEYIDVVEDETTTKAPKKTEIKGPNFPPGPPEGPSLVEFIKLLRANPNYRDIPDPKPIEKAETTTLASSSTVLVPTAPPEFISILAKIRSDMNYKAFENEKPQSTTTNFPVLQIENVKDIRTSSEENLESEVEEFVERPQYSRNYNVPTQIDYTKYKTIDRGIPLRDNTNSRSSLLGKSKIEGTEDSVLIHKDSNRSDVHESNKSEEDDNTAPIHNMEETKITPYVEKFTPETTTIAITTKRNARITSRGRRRFTTISPGTSSTKTITLNNQRSRSGHRKDATSSAQASLRSRRRKITSSTEDPIRSRRYLTDIPQSNRGVPDNHKKTYSPITSSDLPNNDHLNRVVATPRPVTNVVLNHMKAFTKNNLNVATKNSNNAPPSSVEVLKDYDKTKKHGGNYRYEKVEIKKVIQRRNYSSPDAYEIENVEVSRLTDVVPKPFAFYSDPQLPRNVNGLGEVVSESGVKYLEPKVDERDASERDVGGKEYKMEQTKRNKYEMHDVGEDEREFKAKKREKHGENDHRMEDIPDSNNKDIYEDIIHHHVQSVQSEGKSTFIKDPSQRLYFYAPI